MSKWKLARYLLVAAFVLFAAWQVRPYIRDLVSLFQHKGLDYLWLSAAVVAQILQYVMDGFVLRSLLKILGYTVKLKHTIEIAVLDVFGINFLPVGGFGSLVAFVYFYRRLGVRTHALVFLNVLSGFADATVLVGVFIISAIALRGTTFSIPLQTYALGALALMAPVLLVIALLLMQSWSFRGNLNILLHRYGWFQTVLRNLDLMQEMSKDTKQQRPKFVAELLTKNFLYHLTDMFILFAGGLAFHEFIPPFLVIFAYVVSLTVGMVSFLPGGIGAVDAVLLLILTAAEVRPSVALGVVLLNRVVSYLLPTLLGAIAYLLLRRELRART